MPDDERVVHLVDDLQVGGAQRLLVTWAKEARRRGDPVTVVSLAAPQGSVCDELRALGVEVLDLPRRPSGAPGLARQVLALALVLARRRPCVVQTHLTHAHLVGLPAARLARVPSVATLHSMRVGGDGNSDRALRVETSLLRRAPRVVVACGLVVEKHQRERLAPRTAVVVPNATEQIMPLAPADRAALRRKVSGADDALILVAVGRLVDGKGYDDLLDAFATVAAADPRPVLVLVGDGPERERLLGRAGSLGLAGRVRLLGQRDDVAELLSACDLYVSASHWEGLPLAMLEAMAAGLPVAVTAVGDVPVVVDDGCGRLVPPRDPQALASALQELLADVPRLRALGDGARRRAADVAGVEQWYDGMRRAHGLARHTSRRAG